MLWDTFNNLWDSIDNQWLLFSAAAVLVVLFGVLAGYKFYKSKPYDAIQDQHDGWTPTGRIDFSDPQSIGNFILQAEDTQLLTAWVV